MPGGFACNSVYPPLSLTRVARLTWTGTAPQYQIWVSSSAEGAGRVLLTTTTANTIDLRSNLLNGLAETLLNLLIGQSPLYVDVVAMHSTGWTSVATARLPFRSDGLVGGLLGGIRCGV